MAQVLHGSARTTEAVRQRQQRMPPKGNHDTKPKYPWTNGQVERMNRMLKEATVRRYHYETNDQLRQHLADFVNAYNFGRRLKTLRGLTPYEAICAAWMASRIREKKGRPICMGIAAG